MWRLGKSSSRRGGHCLVFGEGWSWRLEGVRDGGGKVDDRDGGKSGHGALGDLVGT